MSFGDLTNVTTGEARLSFCHLFKAHAQQLGGEEKFSTTILVPKSDTSTKARIDAAIEAAKQKGIAGKWNGVCPPDRSRSGVRWGRRQAVRWNAVWSGVQGALGVYCQFESGSAAGGGRPERESDDQPVRDVQRRVCHGQRGVLPLRIWREKGDRLCSGSG